MSNDNNNSTNDNDPYQKYAKQVIQELHSQGIDAVAEPDKVDEKAEEMAEMLVLDADKLAEAAHDYVPEGTLAGTISTGDK